MDPRRRKPYVPIDTCSPGGTWIEEKSYNKVRREGAAGLRARNVLCGNWQEEKALEDDLLSQRRPASQAGLGPDGDFTSSAVMLASLDAIRQGPGGRFTGGHRSTPYLTSDARNPNARFLETTHRHDFTETNGDVRRLRRPDLGVRSRVLLQIALDAAKAERDAEEAERRAKVSRMGLDGADLYLSTYHMAHCREEELPVINELCNDYLSDVPITLYTGNPETGKTMTVHGKTPVEPVGERSQFGKHTYFTDRKYAL